MMAGKYLLRLELPKSVPPTGTLPSTALCNYSILMQAARVRIQHANFVIFS